MEFINETVTNCHALKLPAADGKHRKTHSADLEGIFRIIQSIPSKKAEPIKLWLSACIYAWLQHYGMQLPEEWQRRLLL